MDFYRCNTPEGVRLADTQLNAKALDKDRKIVPYALETHKAAIMATVNALLAGTHELQEGAPVRLTRSFVGDGSTVEIVEAEPVELERNEVAPPPRRSNTNCPSCQRSPTQARRVAALLDAGNSGDVIAEAILDMVHGWELDKLEAAIAERRTTLAKEAA